MTGASIATDAEGRVEIRIGAQQVQLAGDTILDIVRFDDRVVELALRQGRIGVRLRRLDEGDTVALDLQRGGVWLLQPGAYDIEAGGAEQPIRLAAVEGEARFVGGGADVTLKQGDRALLSGTPNLSSQADPASADDFAGWCRSRDAAEEDHPAALRFLSPSMTGYESLDANGSWEGGVWYPRAVPADWAPYRLGHWRWIAPWGWTWIDEMPWGFAPTHYGRWSDIGQRWGWVPGAYAARPLYAPALVAFLGTPGVGLSFAEGHGPAIGWFPLAPGEVYWPSYTADLGYIRALNQPSVGDVDAIRLGPNGELPVEVFNEHFANREAATVVPRAVFARGGAVTAALLQLPEQRLLDAPVIMGSPQISAMEAAAAAAPAASVAKAVLVLRGGRAGGHVPRSAAAHAAGTHVRAPAFVVTAAAKYRRTVKFRTGERAPATARLSHPPPPGLRLAHAGRTRKLRR